MNRKKIIEILTYRDRQGSSIQFMLLCVSAALGYQRRDFVDVGIAVTGALIALCSFFFPSDVSG
jgi:hypothetical protein